jgi:hypothetical protein
MRRSDRRSRELFSYVDVERRIRRDHPLRSIRGIVNEALDALSGDDAEKKLRDGSVNTGLTASSSLIPGRSNGTLNIVPHAIRPKQQDAG